MLVECMRISALKLDTDHKMGLNEWNSSISICNYPINGSRLVAGYV